MNEKYNSIQSRNEDDDDDDDNCNRLYLYK